MNCKIVQDNLSAYIDEMLSQEEMSHIRNHLKTCMECKKAYAELKSTVHHIQSVKDLAPPTWLRQKVMAQVREEAGKKKGIWQRLFFPYHIKIPLETAAVIAIAVTAFFVYQSVKPQLETPTIDRQPGIDYFQANRARLNDNGYKKEESQEYAIAKHDSESSPYGFITPSVTVPDSMTRPDDITTGLSQDIKDSDYYYSLHVEDVKKAIIKIEDIFLKAKGERIKSEATRRHDLLIYSLPKVRLQAVNDQVDDLGKLTVQFQKDTSLQREVKVAVEVIAVFNIDK